MSKTYDALMKLLDEKGSIPDDEAAKLIKEHGPLDEEEKKKIAAAIKMAKVLNKKDDQGKEKDKDPKKADEDQNKEKGEKKTGEDKDQEKGKDEKKDKPSDDDATMDDYLRALSVLDSDAVSQEDKEKAQKVKDKFERQ